jgi:hypothetical protein
MGLSFTIAAGPRQRIYSRVRVPWDSRPYFTVSDRDFPFCLLLRLAGLRRGYSTPLPHGNPATAEPIVLKITPRHGPRRKHPIYCCVGVFTEQLHNGPHRKHRFLLSRACTFRPLPRNGRCLPSHCLATGLYDARRTAALVNTATKLRVSLQ